VKTAAESAHASAAKASHVGTAKATTAKSPAAVEAATAVAATAMTATTMATTAVGGHSRASAEKRQRNYQQNCEGLGLVCHDPLRFQTATRECGGLMRLAVGILYQGGSYTWQPSSRDQFHR